MAAFNTIGGKPMHAHRRLLTGVLKDEWGMRGVIVGDADGVANLVPHGVATDLPDAVRQSVQAGLDIEMGGSLTDDGGQALLVAEELGTDRVDDAVRRILTLKTMLGLFDQPYVPEDEEITEPTRAARALVRAAAARSTVLLKNDGTLPVTPSGRVLLTGPYATSTDHLGAWTQSFAAPASSIADELTGRYPLVRFTVEPGAGFYDDDPANLETVAAAAASHDLVLVFAGEPVRHKPPRMTVSAIRSRQCRTGPTSDGRLRKPCSMPRIMTCRTSTPARAAAAANASPDGRRWSYSAFSTRVGHSPSRMAPAANAYPSAELSGPPR